MRGVSKPLLALAAILLLALSLSACGGGDSDDPTATATTGAATATPPQQSAGEKGEANESAGGGSSEDSPSSSGSGSTPAPTGEGSDAFRTPGGDNSIQTFGEEADSDEIDAANSALAGYMQARSEEDWQGMCADLAATTLAPLEDLASRAPQFKGKGCAAILEGLLSTSQSLSRTNTLIEGIASLRVEGDRAFALFHGPKGVDYFVPMVKEDGEWKVGALAPSEFP